MFIIDPQLKSDSFLICNLELSSLLLMNNANFLWLILVPRKEGLVELIDLDFNNQIKLLKEINQVSKLLLENFLVDKINIASLGNIVKQLHVHVIGRMNDDIAYPKTVWSNSSVKKYEDEEKEELIKRIKKYFNNTNFKVGIF